ncbi:AAA family ATPase [Nonomuraea sp. NPDC002799]
MNAVRRREINFLLAELDAISHKNAGRVVELTGEPGAGKTRVVAVLAREASRRGMTVLTGRCDESDRHGAFRPFTQALAGHGICPPQPLDEVAAEYHPDKFESLHQHDEIRRALSDLAAGGAVLVLDDFHYADAESVELVERLVRSPVPGLLLLVALRARQAPAQLRAAFAHAVELGTVVRVQLRPLSLSQSAEMLAIPLEHERLRQLHHDSDGIPAYLLELARTDESVSTVDTEPPSTVLTELATLSPAESVALGAAAVLGDAFDLEGLSYVAGLRPSSTRTIVSSLVRRDLIRPVDKPLAYKLRHTVIREVVYTRSDPTWRMLAHRRALRLLTSRNRPVEVRAVHIERLLDHPEYGDLPMLVQAATEAIAEHSSSAVRWMQAALRSARPVQLTYPARLEMSLTLARALVAASRVVQAREILREVLAIDPGGPPALRVSAVTLCAQLEWLLGYHAEASTLISGEVSRLPAQPTLDSVALIVTEQLVRRTQGDAKAYEQAARYVRLARAAGDRIAEVGALTLVTTHRAGAGDVQAARASLAACTAIIGQIADRDLAETVEYLAVLGWAQCGLEQFSDAKRHLHRGLRLARKTGQHHLLPFILIGLSKTYLAIGPLDKALRSARDAAELAHELGSGHLEGLSLAMQSLCTTAAEPDDRHAVELAEQAVAALPVEESWWRAELTMSLANAVLATGDPLRCLALLLDAGGGPELEELPLVKRAGCFEMMTMAAATAGDLAGADEWAHRAEQVAESTRLTSHRAHAQASRAHVLSATGEFDKALRLYREAAELFTSLHMARARAWMLFMAAPCALAADMFRDAASMLALSRELARRSGAWDLYGKVKARQRALEKIGRLDPPGVNQDPVREKLTAREYEIARIAATGKRTKEIAKELSLSARTVEVHLSRIYRKLHVNSRAALVSKMAKPPDRLSFAQSAGVAPL